MAEVRPVEGKPTRSPHLSPGRRRWRAVLAYDGRAFLGWQYLAHGPSVQEEVERAVAAIAKEGGRIPVHASGRTDSGVHALGQVIHWDAPDTLRMDGEAWMRAMNAHLPPTVRVLQAEEAPPGFHARFSATGKHYRYRILTGPVLLPQDYGLAWHVHGRRALDVAAMTSAAAIMVGEHDFSAFAAFRRDGTDGEVGTGANVRRLTQAAVRAEGEALVLDFEGGGFLYRMVRLLTGALVHVGRGLLDEAAVADLLACQRGPDGRVVKSPLCAPPDGLTLMRVDYEKEWDGRG